MKARVLGCAAVLAISIASGEAHAQAVKPAPTPAAAPKGGATAAKPPPTKYRAELPVLGLSSEDVEDQAEALSGALRSRVRATPGVTIDDTTTLNLSTLSSALGCPSRPDPLCLIKIGDQLKVERFVWGTLRKGPDKGQVTADVHLWRRGKPDSAANETYSDNLRDQNDDVLRRIAGRLADKLLGQSVAAPVTLRVGDATGEIIVDGGEHVSLVRGEATLELRPGLHKLEIRAQGMPAETHEVEVTSTGEQVLSIKLGEQKQEPPTKPISARKVLALGFIGLGVGFGIAGTVKAAQFMSIKDENDRDHKTLDAQDFCDTSKPHTADVNTMDAACKRLERGENARLLEIIFYSVAAVSAGTGLVLLVTDKSETGTTSARANANKPKLRFSPHVGKSSGGVDLSLRF